ncbi:hypothetical protein StrepF001_09720 [Streptomyces sp. F001]|nr:hypothetical protein StrepF001_09720 [Streptomyces sp. F001]
MALRDRRWPTAGKVRQTGPAKIAEVLADAGYPEGDRRRISTAMTDAGGYRKVREPAGRKS